MITMAGDFANRKKCCLSSVDLSRKGSVDLPILDLITFINDQSHYFTTSSCSGRIVLFEESTPIQKKGCRWLLVSHNILDTNNLIHQLDKIEGDTVFKFEPFVLHVQCLHLEDAQNMHAVAVASGFRNSGITVGKKGKVMVAVRSTHSLEVPIAQNGNLLVSHEYIQFLVGNANKKMEENLKRIERFFENLKAAVLDKLKDETSKRKQGTDKVPAGKSKDDTKKMSRERESPCKSRDRKDNCDTDTAVCDFMDLDAVNNLFIEPNDIS